MSDSSQTVLVQGFLNRLNAGDDSAREDLLNCVTERLRRLARKMLRGFPKVRRWEETDDVFVNAMMRLTRAVQSVQPESARHFFRLAAVQIRRELLDLSRHYYGPLGAGAHHASATPDGSANLSPVENAAAESFDPLQPGGWEEFHRQVGELPDDEREVFELLWYHELTQADAAKLLDVSRRTIIRRWQSACLRLHDAMQGDPA